MSFYFGQVLSGTPRMMYDWISNPTWTFFKWFLYLWYSCTINGLKYITNVNFIDNYFCFWVRINSVIFCCITTFYFFELYKIKLSKKIKLKILKIIKSLKDSGVLIDGVTEIVKHEIKTRIQISWCDISTFGCFNGMTCDFFSGKKYHWKRCYEVWKRSYKGRKSM